MPVKPLVMESIEALETDNRQNEAFFEKNIVDIYKSNEYAT